MKLHKRQPVVALAENEIQGAVWNAVDRHGLTPAELVRICGNLTAIAANLALRVERHGPDSNKKADEA